MEAEHLSRELIKNQTAAVGVWDRIAPSRCGTTYYLLFTVHYLLFAVYCLLTAPCYLLLATYYLLLATYYLLLTTDS